MTTFNYDEWGNPQCPVIHVQWEYPEDDSVDHRLPSRRMCGEDVMLVVSFAVPISRGEPGAEVDVKDSCADSVSSNWEVKCNAGHVLAISDGEENAENFVWSEVFG
jgi:hypothetical protein